MNFIVCENISNPCVRWKHTTIYYPIIIWQGAHRSVVVKALMLQNQKVAGSIPDEVIFLNLPNPFVCTRPWGLLNQKH
jgi:hypothetical protein